MRVGILGGPHDGLTADVNSGIGEGQKFLVDGVEYFFHKPVDRTGKLIYYVSSKES